MIMEVDKMVPWITSKMIAEDTERLLAELDRIESEVPNCLEVAPTGEIVDFPTKYPAPAILSYIEESSPWNIICE